MTQQREGDTSVKILFSIDGSTCSSQAIETALSMKCPMGTEMRVVTVVSAFEPFPAVEDAVDREMVAATNLVDNAVKRLAETHPNVEVSGQVLEGYVVEQIIDYSEGWPADLIMVGSHGRRGITEFVLGSVSRSILNLARCAVRVVRKGEKKHDGEGLNVLIALEESEHTRHMIDHVLRLPWPAGSRFRCLNVLQSVDESVLFDPDIEFAKTAARHFDGMVSSRKEWLQETANKINETFSAEVAETEVLIGDPRKMIIQAAGDWPADIIMLGSHCRQGIDRLVLGSVSEAVATHAPCSVEVTKVPAFRSKKLAVHA
ncbi:MAG: universal stress protein [Cyanobacteria bacterium HKST-UBA02]|nr:universal stress protein [Cyanobacteria bacterium HKST-UBA02]